MTLDLDGSRGPDVLGFVGWLFAALAFAACAVLAAVLAPRPLAAAARRVGETPGRAFVYGIVSLPVFFVLCVVLAVTIIGIPLLLLLAPAYLAVLFAGAGINAPALDELSGRTILPTYGAGLRVQLDKRQRTGVRADYARGRDGASGLYIGFNQAF